MLSDHVQETDELSDDYAQYVKERRILTYSLYDAGSSQPA
jgi:hypothetical protein